MPGSSGGVAERGRINLKRKVNHAHMHAHNASDGFLPASERMVVLMSLRENMALGAKARRAEAAELRMLLDVLATIHAETLRRFEAAERKLDETLAALARSGTNQ
jgi:hypothetical protein